MRLVLLMVCMLVAAGVFAVILFQTWSSHRAAALPTSLPRSLAAELLWAAVPCLMLVAAATPAVIAIVKANASNARAPNARWLVQDAEGRVPEACIGEITDVGRRCPKKEGGPL